MHLATMLSVINPTVTTLLHARELLAGEVFVVDEEQVEASEKGKGQEQEQGQAPVGKSQGAAETKGVADAKAPKGHGKTGKT